PAPCGATEQARDQEAREDRAAETGRLDGDLDPAVEQPGTMGGPEKAPGKGAVGRGRADAAAKPLQREILLRDRRLDEGGEDEKRREVGPPDPAVDEARDGEESVGEYLEVEVESADPTEEQRARREARGGGLPRESLERPQRERQDEDADVLVMGELRLQPPAGGEDQPAPRSEVFESQRSQPAGGAHLGE